LVSWCVCVSVKSWYTAVGCILFICFSFLHKIWCQSEIIWKLQWSHVGSYGMIEILKHQIETSCKSLNMIQMFHFLMGCLTLCHEPCFCWTPFCSKPGIKENRFFSYFILLRPLIFFFKLCMPSFFFLCSLYSHIHNSYTYIVYFIVHSSYVGSLICGGGLNFIRHNWLFDWLHFKMIVL